VDEIADYAETGTYSFKTEVGSKSKIFKSLQLKKGNKLEFDKKISKFFFFQFSKQQ
jgi:hypothetical protein